MFGAFFSVLFVLLVAVCNLALGFWLVVCLGRGPKSWRRLLAAIAEPIVIETGLAAEDEENPSVVAQPAAAPEAVAKPKPTSAAAKPQPEPQPAGPAIQESKAQRQNEPTVATDDFFGDPVLFDAEPFGEIPPELRPAEKIAARIAQLTHCCEENFSRLYKELDDANLQTETQAHTFAAQFAQLVERHLNYLDTTLLSLQRLEVDGFSDLSTRTLLDDLSLRLNELQPELSSLQHAGENAALLHARLTAVLDAIVHICRSTRDELEISLLEFLPQQIAVSEIDGRLFEATSGSALGRLLVERTLALWKAGRSDQSQPCAVGVVDADELAELNQTYGPRVGNLLMSAIERVVRRSCADDAVIGRLRGGSVVFLLPQHTADEAIQTTERIRQWIEKSTFQFDGRELRATVSGAAAEIDFEQNGARLLELLRAALDEAKSYGRNRTFIVDGDYPTLVVPPALEIEPEVVAI